MPQLEDKREPELEFDEKRMSFTEHLGELRTRIIHSGIAVIVSIVLCFILSNLLLILISNPLSGIEGGGMTVMNPLEIVLIKLKIATYAGFVFASPYLIWQICAFIFPGLYPKERKAIQMVLIFSAILAIVGVIVAYVGVLPILMPYLQGYIPEGWAIQLRANETIAIVVKFLAAFAVAFQFPMVVLVLVYMGLLTPQTLKNYRRHAIVGLAVGSALLTPPDPISMMIMMTPLVLLYEVSILVSYLVVRKKKKQSETDQD